MSEIFKINQHIYRAYPSRFFCDGVEIPAVEFYAAIKSLYRRS